VARTHRFPVSKTVRVHRCLKKFEGFKVSAPEVTVSKIGDAFSRLNLFVSIAFGSNDHVPGTGSYYRCAARLRPLDDPEVILGITFGKGTTPALCAASGAAEMAERFSALMNLKNWRNNSDILRSAGLTEQDRSGLPELFADASERFSACGIDYPRVYRHCTSLATGEVAVYPAGYYRLWQTSQGLAAGNTLEEAIVQGICEVIERNTLRVVFSKGLATALLDPMNFRDSGVFHELHGAITEAGVRITYHDWSLWGVPVVGAVFENATEPSLRSSRCVVGVATSPSGAAVRCLTEYLQSGNPCMNGRDEAVGQLSRLRTRITGLDSPEVLSFSEALGLGKALPALYGRNPPAAALPIARLSDLPDVSHRDLAVEIRRMVRALDGHGIELFVDDLTLPALGFPVVRLIPVVRDPSIEEILHPVLFYNIPSDSRPLTVQIRNVAGWHRNARCLWDTLSEGSWFSRRHPRAIGKLIRLLESHVGRGGYDSRGGLLGTDVPIFHFLARLSMAVHDVDRAERYNEACMLEDRTDPEVLLDRIWIARQRGDERTAEDFTWLLRQMDPKMDIEEALEQLYVKILQTNPFVRCGLKCVRMAGHPLCRECVLRYVPKEVWAR
jgi:ribosomal protein S12 methylthiotransferase accessory factor YcaO